MYINKHFRQQNFLRNSSIIVKLHYTLTDEAYLSYHFQLVYLFLVKFLKDRFS